MATAPYFYCVVAWVIVSALQCGYHTSALNQIQFAMSCRTYPHSLRTSLLPSCVEMDDAAFGVLTSMFTVGGLCGSLTAVVMMHRFGRKGATLISALCISVGSAIMSAAATYYALLVGRLLIGMGVGLGICIVPIYLAEISPPNVRGSVGVLNQLSIVSGLLVTQALGIPLAAPSRWRFVLVISLAISLFHLASSWMIIETPAWLDDKQRHDEAAAVERRLRGESDSVEPSPDEPSEGEPLLGDARNGSSAVPVKATISVWGLLTTRELRAPTIIVLAAFLAQQGSGINAILYFSNDILGRVWPALAAYISLLITVINVVMTFPPVFLIERVGRRAMFLFSAIGSLISLIAVAIGLNIANAVLSSVGVLAFVTCFSVGLGPVPFVIVSEIVPFYAVGSISSLAIAWNSIVNIFIAAGFLPLRNLLSRQGCQDGNIFYIFAAILAISTLVVGRMYHP